MLDAVTVQPTGKDGVSYTRVTTDASASTNTAEGAALAENEIDTTDAIAPVRNIGSQMPVTDQALADEEQVGELIRRLLVRDARRRLENQIYNGTGSGQQIQGFSTTTGIQTAYDGTTESSAAIAYEKGAAEYEDEYQMEPGIAVMSATTWGLYAASATTTGALAGPREAITDGIRRMAWGTPVITNSLVDRRRHLGSQPRRPRAVRPQAGGCRGRILGGRLHQDADETALLPARCPRSLGAR